MLLDLICHQEIEGARILKFKFKSLFNFFSLICKMKHEERVAFRFCEMRREEVRKK